MNKFKNGDTVKIIDNTSNSYNKVNDVGIIVELEPSYCRVFVQGRSGAGNWSRLSDLELIIKKLPFFEILNKPTRNGEIHRVANNQGNVFFKRDIVIGLTENAKKWGEMTILYFRKSNDNTNICAVTKQTSPYGIGIDKLQHIIKIKNEEIISEDSHFFDLPIIVKPEEESLLEKANRLYPVGTIYQHADENGMNSICQAIDPAQFYDNSQAIGMGAGSDYVFYHGNWATIIK